MSLRLPDLTAMLRQLIATPSISSVTPELDTSNRPLIELLAGWLDSAGFAVEILDIPGQPDKFNLIATLGTRPDANMNEGAEGLVLSGHSDTVPCDEHRWRTDPFTLTEANDRYYGLGSADMKSFFALALEAIRDLNPRQLTRPLTLLATADEESAMHGAQALLAAGRPRGRWAIIGEPTGLRPVRLHKGVMAEAIRLTGKSGHASNPAGGRSALEGMHEVLGMLLAWREELQARYPHAAFRLPWPTLSAGYIHGGDNFNRICGECELHLDLRLVPGLAPETLRTELAERVGHIARRRDLAHTVTPLFTAIPPFETAATSAIVRACERLSGHPAEAADFGTEAPFLSQLGCETVVLGPGHIAQAHQPDEYLPLAHIKPTLTLLRGLVQHFCIAPNATPGTDPA